MIQLNFRGDKELVQLKIDRVNKKLWIISSKTGYKEKEVNWKRLFDSGKETIQDRITSKLDDKRFIIVITQSMNKVGYTRLL